MTTSFEDCEKCQKILAVLPRHDFIQLTVRDHLEMLHLEIGSLEADLHEAGHRQ